MKRWSRASRLTLATLAVYVAFAVVLALAIARAVRVPLPLLLFLAIAGLVLTLAALSSALLRLLRGPPVEPFEVEGAIRCTGEEAEAIRSRALRRAAAGGAGFARRWAAALPVAAWVGGAGVLLAGILNFAMRIEGTWVQWADSGRDLDLRETYRTLDAGVFGDPRELRYGVLVGEVRPTEPARLMDVSVVDSTGKQVRWATLAPGGDLELAGGRVYSWGYGPGLHLTLVHREQGKLLDEPIPLWPADRPGTFGEHIENGTLGLELEADGWPFAAAEGGVVRAKLRNGAEVLYDGPLEPRKVYQTRDGYGLVCWENRTWVGLGIAHRTYRTLSLWSLVLLGAGAFAAWLLPARPFRYREDEGGAVTVSPPDAWAQLARRR